MKEYSLNYIEKKTKEQESELTEKTQNSQTYEVGLPGYLDDFLNHSKKKIFFIGNNGNIVNSSPKKKIIKKKKIKKDNNKKYIKTENEKKNEIEITEFKKKIILNHNNITNEKNNSTFNEIKDIKNEKIKHYIIRSLDISAENKYEKEEYMNNNKGKINLKKKLINFENKQNLDIYKKIFIFYKLVFFHQIKALLKSVYIFIKMKNAMNLSVKKISSSYLCYRSCHNLKFNYVIYKILSIREQNSKRIISNIKSYFFRKQVKKLLEKAENYNIIYSSLNIDKNDILYFKYKHKNGKEQNFYFEYSPVLKCFIYFVNKNDDKYLKIIEGNFYNSKSIKLIDKSFEINNKGENIINIPKLFQKSEIINEKNDRIINRFIKLHKPKKRMTIDEYEDSKKKTKDDYNLKNISKSQKLPKLGNISRSKSFVKIKGEIKTKSILKPSRSYVNLKCAEKKIQFGKAKIRKYKNKKD